MSTLSSAFCVLFTVGEWVPRKSNFRQLLPTVTADPGVWCLTAATADGTSHVPDALAADAGVTAAIALHMMVDASHNFRIYMTLFFCLTAKLVCGHLADHLVAAPEQRTPAATPACLWS